MQSIVQLLQIKVLVLVSLLPQDYELLKALVLTLGARAVPGGQGSGFIQEKQLGIAARTHYFLVAAFEFQQTNDPAFSEVVADDFLSVIVQSAPVAHQQAPFFGKANFPVWIDSILQWHDYCFYRRFALLGRPG